MKWSWAARLAVVVIAFLSRLGARIRGRREERARIAADNAEKQEDYAQIAAEHRTADDAADRMRDGNF